MRLTVLAILYLLSHLVQGQNCDPGKYWNGSTCVPCPKGTYCPGGNPAPKVDCPAGTFQNKTGQIKCDNCPAGKYQSQTGQSTCLTCGAGSFSPVDSSVACTSCSAGQYQPDPGKTSCLDCPAGMFQSGSGQEICLECDAGTYQPSTGSASCIDCAAGSYQPDIASTSCILCPKGTYQNQTGQISCDNCPIGFTTVGTGSDEVTDCNVIATPVRLVEFQAKSFAKGVWLTWETAEETNSAFFAIERSQNGRDYRMIGQLKAAGNYTGSTHYYFTDSVPGAGTNYYRLRQVDRDGKYWISPARQVNYVSRSGVQIYPNPVRTQVMLSHPTDIIEQVAFYGQNGAQVVRMSLGVRTQQIDLSRLAPGIYMMEVVVGGKRFMEKVVKQ